MYDFLPVFFNCFSFLSNLFNYRFWYCIHLYTWPTQQVIVAQHMCWFLKASNTPKFSSINYLNSSNKGRWFPFSFHILSTCYTRLFNITSYYWLPMFLLLVADQSRLCIFYYDSKEWSKRSSWSCWIPLVAWPGRDISGDLNNLWILFWCHMEYISFGSLWHDLWHRADILWWVFGYCPLSSYPGFLESMLCALGSCCDGGCVSDK